eukprot:GDKI01010893.1.p1 GENE.GDKI01010893.1~~GDKI01010893.1.p1  ORF type:complete len:324 (-),score=78.75 GDKI01010893.1:61-1032(-)
MEGECCVLVTGGSGLLGHAISAAVEKLGLNANSCKWVFLSSKDGDLRNREATRALFEKHRPTHVVHLAARVGGLFANMADQIGFFRDNMQMNDNVITLCHEYKVRRAIFCLSTCVYPAEVELPITEDKIHAGPPHFSNEGYAMAKRMLECMCRFYRSQHGCDFLCVIPTNLYGPNDNFHLQDAHVMPALIHKCHLSKANHTQFVVSGSGKPLRQFLYSLDAGRIIVELLRAPPAKIDFSSVILCGDQEDEPSIGELSEHIVRAMKFEGEMKFDTSKADGIFRKTASNARLRAFLGPDFKFTPLPQGIEETVSWFEQHFETCRR